MSWSFPHKRFYCCCCCFFLSYLSACCRVYSRSSFTDASDDDDDDDDDDDWRWLTWFKSNKYFVTASPTTTTAAASAADAASGFSTWSSLCWPTSVVCWIDQTNNNTPIITISTLMLLLRMTWLPITTAVNHAAVGDIRKSTSVSTESAARNKFIFSVTLCCLFCQN